jgi:hypothetical protein
MLAVLEQLLVQASRHFLHGVPQDGYTQVATAAQAKEKSPAKWDLKLLIKLAAQILAQPTVDSLRQQQDIIDFQLGIIY